MNKFWLAEFKVLGTLVWIVPVTIATLVLQLAVTMFFPFWYYLGFSKSRKS